MVCWITPKTWESLILYLNSHLHCPATLRQAGNVCQDTSHGNGVPWNPATNLQRCYRPRSAPLSSLHIWFLPIPRCCKHSVKNEMRPFFFKTLFATTQLTQLQIPLFSWFANMRCQYCSHFLRFKKTAGTKNRRWVLKFSCKFERFLAYYQQNRRSWQRFLETYLTNPFGQETTCVVLDAPGVYCVWVFGALCCRLGLPQLWRNYPGNSWRGKGKQHLKRKAMLKDILHRVRWDMINTTWTIADSLWHFAHQVMWDFGPTKADMKVCCTTGILLHRFCQAIRKSSISGWPFIYPGLCRFG